VRAAKEQDVNTDTLYNQTLPQMWDDLVSELGRAAKRVRRSERKRDRRPKERRSYIPEDALEIGSIDDALRYVKEGKLRLEDANMALQQLEPYKGYRIINEGGEYRVGVEHGTKDE
jgi:hypothetical protein